MFIQELEEEVSETAEGGVETTGEILTEGEEEVVEEGASYTWVWIVIIIVALIAVGAGVGMRKKK